jgi:phage N-6-adenine-methyltransferase
MNLEPSKSEEHGTPLWLFRRLDEEFHFELDAAASPVNAKCAKYFTKEDDALQYRWEAYKSIFINPPYNHRALWAFMLKSLCTVLMNEGKIVLLVPCKTDQDWWCKIVVNFAQEIRFIHRRIRYEGNTGQPQFASCIIVFDGQRLGQQKIGFMEQIKSPQPKTQKEMLC